MRRIFDEAEPEMLDRPQPVTPELEASLASLRGLNRHFGSYRLVRFFLDKWLVPRRSYRILDLATGSGDIPRMIVRWARERRITVRIDAVDLQPATLEIARKRSADFSEITFIRADARNFCDEMTYDLVCCSLALHHFSELDAIKILRRACELSHDKVLISDLERSWLTWLCVYFITAAVFSDPMTKYDGRLSVRRAFSFHEIDQLAQQAGWRNFGHRRFFPARQALWMSAKEEAPVMDLSDPTLDFAT
jgi:2-polyprenyl-3-methyl-5-hydroxy-6-metoxy-1,4-benzoquinol methylase